VVTDILFLEDPDHTPEIHLISALAEYEISDLARFALLNIGFVGLTLSPEPASTLAPPPIRRRRISRWRRESLGGNT